MEIHYYRNINKTRSINVKIKVLNSGLDFTDDCTFVTFYFRKEVTEGIVEKLKEQLFFKDKELRKVDENENCIYDKEGWNYRTLCNAMEKDYGYIWTVRDNDIEFEIK